jgi:hypothetical protein
MMVDGIAWETRAGRTVGSVGAVRVVLLDLARIPPGLPFLEGFSFPALGPIVSVFASEAELAKGIPQVEIRLTEKAGRQRYELERAAAAVRVPTQPHLDPPPFDRLEPALEAALALMRDAFHAKLA